MSVPHRDPVASQSCILQFLRPLEPKYAVPALRGDTIVAPITHGGGSPQRSLAGGPADGVANIVVTANFGSGVTPSAATADAGLDHISIADLARPAGAGFTFDVAYGGDGSATSSSHLISAISLAPPAMAVIIIDETSDDGGGNPLRHLCLQLRLLFNYR
jgi:hypothetical protein